MKAPRHIHAEIIMQTPGGRSIDDAAAPVTSENVRGYLPGREIVAKVIGELEKLGFTIHAEGPTLSFSGPRKLFEEVFQTPLVLEDVPGSVHVTVRSRSALTIPKTLRRYVSSIVFPEQPEYF